MVKNKNMKNNKSFDFEVAIYSDIEFNEQDLFIKICDLVHEILPESTICGGRSLVPDLMKKDERIKELELYLKEKQLH